MTLPMSKLRVLYICPTPRAGTAQYTHNLAAQIARRGHRVSLLTSVGYELRPYARDYQVIEAIDRLRPRPLRLFKLWRHLRELRPQIVHYQGGQHPDLLLLLDMLLRGGRAGVYTPHDLQSNTPRPHHDRAMQRLLARMDHVYYSSHDNRDYVRDVWKMDPSRHGVFRVPDLMEFTRNDLTPSLPQIPADKRLLLCFGLIEPRKGIATLLEAFAIVRQQVPGAHLAVVGKALMDLAPLQETVARHRMAEAVTIFPDYASFEQLCGWFQRCEVVTLPYESGWNSGVIPVAYGFRKPIVATTVAAADGAVEHERTGLVVPPSDPGALAAALVRMLSDSALCERLRPQVVQAAGACAWQPLVDDTEAVYRQLAAGKP